MKENSETKVSVWQGGAKLDEKTTTGGSVSFNDLTLQETQKIDIKLDNLEAVQSDSEVTVQNTAETTGVSMAFDVNEDNKTVVKRATRTFKRTVPDRVVTKTHIHNSPNNFKTLFDKENITIYGEEYKFAGDGSGTWTLNGDMDYLNIPGGKHDSARIPVVTQWVEADDGKTYICTAELVNHENDKGKGTQQYKFTNIQYVETELPKDPTDPEFNVPTVPMVPLDPPTPIKPTVPMVPLVPATHIKPTVPMVPLVPATPIKPTVPLVPLVPATPITPTTPETPTVPGGGG